MIFSLKSANYNAEGIIDRVVWPKDLQLELEKAESARLSGNEGRARVCARRAAGIAARLYFMNQGKVMRSPSAYDLLKEVAEDPSLPPETRQSAAYLTLPVNEDFKMPPDVDLIREAQNLCIRLLGS